MIPQMHLNKSGSGWTSRTACGRNIIRTPLSANWEDFKRVVVDYQCIKCRTSRQYQLNVKMDARKLEVAQ